MCIANNIFLSTILDLVIGKRWNVFGSSNTLRWNEFFHLRTSNIHLESVSFDIYKTKDYQNCISLATNGICVHFLLVSKVNMA